jgi:hypothetical protein
MHFIAKVIDHADKRCHIGIIKSVSEGWEEERIPPSNWMELEEGVWRPDKYYLTEIRGDWECDGKLRDYTVKIKGRDYTIEPLSEEDMIIFKLQYNI